MKHIEDGYIEIEGEFIRPLKIEEIFKRIIDKVEKIVDEECINLNYAEIRMLTSEEHLKDSIISTIYDQLERNLDL